MPLLARLVANTVLLPLQSLLAYRYTLLLSGVIVANVSFVLAAGALYKLTLAALPKNKQLAHVSSIAFCLSPPAMFMSSFYTESLFALMSFTGMKWVIQKKYLKAALIWGIASAVRSNSIVYSGFFFYDLFWQRLINRQNFFAGFLRSVIYTGITAGGFALFQYYVYTEFCSLDRPWCMQKLPLAYSFVQKEYWDNGFLSYYEIKQIPNFVLAAPIIAISVFGLKDYIQNDSTAFWTLGISRNKQKANGDYHSPKLAVFMYLWTFLLLFATTSMHVQVIIRFFTSVPPFYWFVGNFWIEGFLLSVDAVKPSTPELKSLTNPGTDQVPPIGLPPIKIPPSVAMDSNLPLNIQIDTEGNSLQNDLSEGSTASTSYSFFSPKTTPVRSAASKIGACSTENVFRCDAFKKKGATICSNSSLGTACNGGAGSTCSTEAFNACIDFTGANGLYCSEFGCAQYLDDDE
ncbi:hypothetical protein [Parasitella parasitica]|uniref:GPI mannosyltransferase 2 n=1 Tax=Parasitella parasitica TaxID=35722 RepID=A0A0B7NIV7_9FUNG|nr:hypothetical protein [Parasitella parasitica]